MSFNRDSPSIDSRGTPSPSCQDSGVVTRKLSVPRNRPTAPKLPAAEAWGATGFAAIKEPRVICTTPVSRASLCGPSLLRSREVSGLAVTRTSAFSTS
jgi:hypothetical protein